MAAAVNNGGGRQRWGQTITVVVNEEDTQDRAADYNGEGRTVTSNAGDSAVAMMAAMVEDGGDRQQWQRRMLMVVDDSSSG